MTATAAMMLSMFLAIRILTCVELWLSIGPPHLVAVVPLSVVSYRTGFSSDKNVPPAKRTRQLWSDRRAQYCVSLGPPTATAWLTCSVALRFRGWYHFST